MQQQTTPARPVHFTTSFLRMYGSALRECAAEAGPEHRALRPVVPTTAETNMTRTLSTLTILLLSGAVALAQGGGGGGGGGSGGAGSSGGASSGGGTSSGSSTTGTSPTQGGTGNATTPGGATTGPNNTGGPVPGLSAPSATDSGTTGRAPGVNPANPQDARQRSNPSDRTLPGAQNPQDMKPHDSGTPQIIAPERR
jgi:hypothetical protein